MIFKKNYDTHMIFFFNILKIFLNVIFKKTIIIIIKAKKYVSDALPYLFFHVSKFGKFIFFICSYKKMFLTECHLWCIGIRHRVWLCRNLGSLVLVVQLSVEAPPLSNSCGSDYVSHVPCVRSHFWSRGVGNLENFLKFKVKIGF